MINPTGYTEELTNAEKCKNLFDTVIKPFMGDLDARALAESMLKRHGEITPEYLRELTSYANFLMGNGELPEPIYPPEPGPNHNPKTRSIVAIEFQRAMPGTEHMNNFRIEVWRPRNEPGSYPYNNRAHYAHNPKRAKRLQQLFFAWLRKCGEGLE
jgi:hypothetical protein